MRAVQHWNRLPGEAGDTPNLAVFKAILDGGLSQLVQWEVSLPTAGALRFTDL